MKNLLRLGRPSAEAREMNPVLFLNISAATSSQLFDRNLTEGYRLICQYFCCGLIDRTQTVDTGVIMMPLEPLPVPFPSEEVPELEDLCLARAESILSEARKSSQPILVLWSGGIDSSAALAYLIKAAERTGDLDLLTVGYSRHSKREHPRMFRAIKKLKLARIKKSRTADMTNGWQGLVVTGEGGDQMFGSAKALIYDRDLLLEPWPSVLKDMMVADGLEPQAAQLAFDFIAPQISRGIGDQASAFKALWWLNISCKWNTVMLRMPVMDYEPTHRAMRRYRHFFAGEDFQRWARSQDRNTPPENWAQYKMALRQALLSCDGDVEYFETKLKEPSLCNVIDRGVSSRVVLTAGAADVTLHNLGHDPARKHDSSGDGGGAEGALFFTSAGEGAGTVKTHSFAPSGDSYSHADDGG